MSLPNRPAMESISVNKFRDNLKTFVDLVADRHEPLRVTRRGGQDFIVMSAEDWEKEQETLYVLQSPSLMRQINQAKETHTNHGGYVPSSEELSEVDSI